MNSKAKHGYSLIELDRYDGDGRHSSCDRSAELE